MGIFNLERVSKGRLLAINVLFILWNAFFLGWDIRTDRSAPLTVFQAIVFGYQLALSWESYLSWKHLSQFQRDMDRLSANFKRDIEEYMSMMGWKP